MILTREIEIKLNRGNIPYFKKWFKSNHIGDIIMIPSKNIIW